MIRTIRLALLAILLPTAAMSHATPLYTAAGFGTADKLVTFDEVSIAPGSAVTTQFSAYGVTLSADMRRDSLFFNPANFSGAYIENTGADMPHSIFFNGPVTAAGAYWEFNSGITQRLSAYLNGNLVESYTYTNGGCCESSAFLGFANSGFDEIRLNAVDGDTSFIMDNVSFRPAQISAVPEPVSLALFGIGALGIAVMRKRKHQLR